MPVVAALVLALLAGGCNRLTFVRQDFSRQDYEHTARVVEVNDKSRESGAAKARAHLQLAQERVLIGDYPAAEREAKQALKLDPHSVDAYTLLAASADGRGAATEAGAGYKRAAELAPQDGAVLNNYGVWLCGQGQAAQSLDWFERALADAHYPTPAAAMANSGSCALRAGQGARAQRDLRRALELDAANPVALGAMARLQYQQGNALEARAFSERRLAAGPADRDALMLASQIEQKLGDTAAAARYVQRMRAEFPVSQGSGMGDDGRR